MIPDTLETREHLRKICFFMNCKHIVSIIYLFVCHYALEDTVVNMFWNRVAMQIFFFMCYIYLQGLLNNFAKLWVVDELVVLQKDIN